MRREEAGEGRLVVGDLVRVEKGAVGVGIAAGVDGHAGRHALGDLDEVAGEEDAAGGERIDDGGLDDGVAGAAEGVKTELIEGDEEEVGARGG